MTNIPQGWQCPACGRVYSPGTPACTRCQQDVEEMCQEKGEQGQEWRPAMTNAQAAAYVAEAATMLEHEAHVLEDGHMSELAEALYLAEKVLRDTPQAEGAP